MVDSIMQNNPVFPDYTRILMKNNMKTTWKMLTLAALLSAGTTAATAADNGYVGDLGDDAYFSETSDYVGGLYDDADGAETKAATTTRSAAPSEEINSRRANRAVLEPVAYVGDSDTYYPEQQYDGGIQMTSGSCGCQSGNCGSSSCGGSCGSVCPPSKSMASQTGAYLTAEALLWFPQVRSTPPLVTTADPGVRPELDPPSNAAVAFGGDEAFGGDLQAGFRLDGGLMLSEDFGIGGRFWWLGEGEDTYATANNTGLNGSVGIPFFDADLVAGQENAIRIAYLDNGLGLEDFTGSLNARTSLSIYGAEGYGRLRLLGGKGYRSDLVGGFSHFGIEEEVYLNATTTQVTNRSGVGQGDNYRFTEDLTAENVFYGGQVGMLTSVGRGVWTLSALTKVHLGNMEQTLTSLSSRELPAPAGDQLGGVFADNGTITQDSFCFAPEANLKLAVKLRPNVRFSVGYSFIMWNDVLMVGDNMDRVINSDYLVGNALGVVAPPERQFNEGLRTDSFFVHGLDLGCVIQF